ncbi:MAG: hypothetical protein IJJ69_06080 [Oscillospiraceae bacterium]|nr:hypothetical protein [Oscillospiraceae bacterium]
MKPSEKFQKAEILEKKEVVSMIKAVITIFIIVACVAIIAIIAIVCIAAKASKKQLATPQEQYISKEAANKIMRLLEALDTLNQ